MIGKKRGAKTKAVFTRQNLSWQIPVGKLMLVCVNGTKTVGKHVSI